MQESVYFPFRAHQRSAEEASVEHYKNGRTRQAFGSARLAEYYGSRAEEQEQHGKEPEVA